MAIEGFIVLEDMTITFHQDNSQDEHEMRVRVSRTGGAGPDKAESYLVKQADFLKALAIAMHNDGTPDWQVDYPAAEDAQPADPELRFIP